MGVRKRTCFRALAPSPFIHASTTSTIACSKTEDTIKINVKMTKGRAYVGLERADAGGARAQHRTDCSPPQSAHSTAMSHLQP